jgi:Uma2 family endonuclease
LAASYRVPTEAKVGVLQALVLAQAPVLVLPKWEPAAIPGSMMRPRTPRFRVGAICREDIAGVLAYTPWAMGSAMPPPSWSHPPAVDERLVMPETRYEIEDGRVQYVAPADELHGSAHCKLAALLEAHVTPEFDVAVDMLTRTSETNDFAPDASVFPKERDPDTGMRQIERLAFEIVSTERLSHAGNKAGKLIARGVRRVFAIDVERRRALEWFKELGSWQMLANESTIKDDVFAVALPIEALVSASKADDAVARALIAKRNPVILDMMASSKTEGRLEGKTEGRLEGKLEGEALGLARSVVEVLRARGLEVAEEIERRILDCGDVATLRQWLKAAATLTYIDELLRLML